MNAREALAFVRTHGVVLMSAKGPVPSLAEAIAGAPIRGSWWGHRRSHEMFRIFGAISDSSQVLTCRLVDGKVTFVHRRLWPALVRLAARLPRADLAAVREVHTASGAHRTIVTPFPRWVPPAIRERAARLGAGEAVAALAAAWPFQEYGAGSRRSAGSRATAGAPRRGRRRSGG